MISNPLRYFSIFLVLNAYGALPALAQLQITEVLAMPTQEEDGDVPDKFLDDDDHLSDMIEIHNPGDSQVSLGGYYLTDDKRDLKKWSFPSNQRIDPGGYKIVYASAKDKRGLFATIPHTNFKLTRDGEYLALVSPEGEILTEFDPLPRMYANTSYGPDGYMTSTSFGEANKAALAEPTHRVDFSVSSRTFSGELTIELSSDDLPEGARIGYTTNNAEPAVSLFSPPKYYDVTGPITISETTEIRARVFEDGKLPGRIKTENYVKVSDELQDWSSNLPVVVIESWGSRFNKARFSKSSMLILTPKSAEGVEEKRTSIIQEAELETRLNARQRGSSTGNWPKKSLAMEAWFDDADGADRNITPFGMPQNGDWVLSGRYDFDRALFRNPLAYQFSREMGHWSPRTQFVEVFMNEDGDEVDQSDYVGVFTFMEKIERDEERINLQDPTNRTDGGVMVKVDRTTGQSGTRDTTFNAAGQGFVWIEPEKEFVTSQQNSWLRDHFDEVRRVIRDDDIAEDPERGYRSLIDVESWIDEYVVRTLTKDPDGFRLSTYLYMPRNGKVHYGPVWDFDRTMGCDTDTRAKVPTNWQNVDYFRTFGWWADLAGSRFHNSTPEAARPEFLQDYIDRYQRHRRTVLDIDHMNELIDGFAAQLAEAQVRNFERWTGQRPDRGSVRDFNDGVTGWEGEVVHLKGWLKARVEFMDEFYVSPPGFEPAGGLVESGASVRVKTGGNLFSPQSAYYTTDGSDPRVRGNTVHPSAVKAESTLTVTETMNLVIRAEQSDRWSGPINTAFVVDGIPASTENLLISEIMYHPSEGNAEEQEAGYFQEEYYEFVELMNAGDKDMYIGDIAFTGGITFPFSESAIQALKPGERVVIVSDIEGFELRYGTDLPVGGEYVGKLSNQGERLVLMRGDEVIQDFSYNDREPWPVTPDQFGFSLSLNNPAPGVDLSDPASWGVDTTAIGTPGSSGSMVPNVVINEVLATAGPGGDAIEVFNASNSEVDLSGWFLSDNDDIPNKFTIPQGTVLAGGGYAVFRQDNDDNVENNADLPAEFFGNAFGLNSTGETVYLFSADENGNLTGYRNSFSYADAEPGATYGRYITTSGDSHEVIQQSPTLGAANSGPLVSPVVITEIMYHPKDDSPNPEAEYVEIRNVSSSAVDLFEAGKPENTWRISGVDYQFPASTTLGAGTVAIVTAIDPGVFRAAFNVPASVEIFGPYGGRLDNGGETLRLQRPLTFTNALGEENVRFITMEEVDYNDGGDWPDAADGLGASLVRVDTAAYSNQVSSWAAADGGTPGDGGGDIPEPEPAITLAEWQAQEFTEAEQADAAISGLTADPDKDGLLNLAEYFFQTSPKSADTPAIEALQVRVGQESYGAIRYTRRRGADMNVTLESSRNLNDWQDASAQPVGAPANLGDGRERLVIRDSRPASGDTGSYLRLRLESR